MSLRNIDRPEGSSIRALAVDDDPTAVNNVRQALADEEIEVATAGSGAAALDWVARNGLPDVAIVDLVMPGMDGLELSRRLHETADVPVILVTSVSDEGTVVLALEREAEDYVTKPFRSQEFVARVKKVLRRFGDRRYALGPETVIDDHLKLDFGQRQATVEGNEVSLTPIEAKALHILVRASPRTVPSRFLLDRIWPLEEIFEDTLRVHLHRLRQKIELDPSKPRYVVTHRGRGYSFLGSAN